MWGVADGFDPILQNGRLEGTTCCVGEFTKKARRREAGRGNGTASVRNDLADARQGVAQEDEHQGRLPPTAVYYSVIELLVR